VRQDIKNIQVAHQLDAGWIVALWLAIHGGDPPPENVRIDDRTVELLGETTTHLARQLGFEVKQSLTVSSLQERLKAVTGIEMTAETGAHEAPAADAAVQPVQRGTRQYCFRYKGETLCVDVPSVKLPPPG
jgi:hypothetical protein